MGDWHSTTTSNEIGHHQASFQVWDMITYFSEFVLDFLATGLEDLLKIFGCVVSGFPDLGKKANISDL